MPKEGTLEYLDDFLEFKKVVEEGNFDNRTLLISLEDSFGISEQMVNSATEINGGPQYNIRYKNILVIMYWNETIMRFEFPNYYGVYEEDSLKQLVHI